MFMNENTLFVRVFNVRITPDDYTTRILDHAALIRISLVIMKHRTFYDKANLYSFFF